MILACTVLQENLTLLSFENLTFLLIGVVGTLISEANSQQF